MPVSTDEPSGNAGPPGRAPNPDRAARSLASTPGARPLAYEGLFQSLGQGLGEAYLGAFGLWLHAGAFALGLLAALPTAGTALAQAAAGHLRAGFRGARRFIAGVWAVQAIAYACLGLCAFLAPSWRVVALCGVALCAWSLAGVSVPAWTSLVSDVVPRPRRGAFFGLRGAVQQIGILGALVGGGLLLSVLTSRGAERLGFVLLFLGAGLFRLTGIALLAAVPAQKRGPTELRLAAGVELLRSSRKFRHFALYLWGLHFGTHVAVPFFVPYMLRDLRMDYATIGLLLAVPAVVKALTLRWWGGVADRVGPGPLLRSTGWLVVPVSAAWLVSGSPWWLLLAQVYSGLVWGAFELAQAASLLQTTRGREAAVAFFNLVDGVMMIGGALLGGLIVVLVDGRGGPGYLAAIGGSSLLRALPAAALLWRIRGIGRPVGSLRRLPLRVWAVRPTRGVMLRPWAAFPAGDSSENDDEAR